MIFLLPLIFLAMYWFMIRPQQQKAKAHQALLANLEIGDLVLTASGIYGDITDIDGRTVFIEIADGVEMKVTKESIAEVVVMEDETADAESGDD